jgi:hypothetical protein
MEGFNNGAIPVNINIDKQEGGGASAILATMAVPAGLFIAQKMVQNNSFDGDKLPKVALNVIEDTGKVAETMPQNLYDSLLTLLPNKKKTRKNKKANIKSPKKKTRKN